MRSDDEVRRWAAEWCGIGIVIAGSVTFWIGAKRSDADLAEAVRAKFKADHEVGQRGREPVTREAWERVAFVSMWHGPLAFIQAVREVVDGQ